MSKPFMLPARVAPYQDWSDDLIGVDFCDQYGAMRGRSFIATIDAHLVTSRLVPVDENAVDFANHAVASGLVFA